MKRCPQCLFLYPDSDVRCDFDQTPLEFVDDAEVDRATHQAKPRRKALPFVAVVGLILSVIVFVVYFIGALQMFVQSWILTQGGPLDSTLTVVYLIYLNGFEYLKMGYAAAMSMILFALIAVVTYVNTRIIKYDAYY